ncbi:MAG: hydroxymyristoyl-ACP dehydratase [Nitrosomonadales bacterium]|nr:hydroxymyristoyl-ACP dehydratase [Nitrosomonadales bacterium]
MLIDQTQIRALIPHAGDMCLLTGVIQWDATHITCIAQSHFDTSNPMARDGKVRALCGIEFAAQAMAVHGGLTGAVGRRPRAGLLVSVRDVVARVEYLSDYNEDMLIDAEQLMSEQSSVCYNFTLHAGEVELLRGRATVVLDADRATA